MSNYTKIDTALEALDAVPCGPNGSAFYLRGDGQWRRVKRAELLALGERLAAGEDDPISTWQWTAGRDMDNAEVRRETERARCRLRSASVRGPKGLRERFRW